MTRSRDHDRILGRWMDDGPRAVADHVIAGAMTEIQTTRQRSARWATLSEHVMSVKHATMVLGLAATVIVGIATYLSLSGAGQRAGDVAETQRIVSATEVPDAWSGADLADIVVTNENAPEGWTVEATLRGREVLAYLIRYGEVTASTPGLIDARATDFCADGRVCGTSWVALYESDADAETAYSHVRDEMQVGWGLGIYARSLGFEEDQGSAYRNNLGNAAASHAYLWRTGPLVLGVVALGEMDVDALRPFAEGMNARVP